MAVEDAQPQRRGALFGVQRAYVDALEAQLVRTEGDLATAGGESAELTASLRSARLALEESAGWSQRLPVALRELATLAAGHLDMDGEDPKQRLAAAVLDLAGEHLLASVEVSIGEPAGELQRDTRLNENSRPVRTIVRLGACAVDCIWHPGIDAPPDTVQVIEGLAAAVVCSLAGVAASRAERNQVTQLGDARSLSRHLALRNRLDEPVAILLVTVDGESAIEHRELYGRLAWSASFADAASALDRLARSYGGEAYQTDDREFRLLVDAADVDAARYAAQEELSGYDGLDFRVAVDRA